MFKVIKTEGRARRGEFTCRPRHGADPGFHERGNPGRPSRAALRAIDLEEIGCQIELSNTYHLHLRPGDEVVKAHGRDCTSS